jgi:hypothetical protein
VLALTANRKSCLPAADLRILALTTKSEKVLGIAEKVTLAALDVKTFELIKV